MLIDFMYSWQGPGLCDGKDSSCDNWNQFLTTLAVNDNFGIGVLVLVGNTGREVKRLSTSFQQQK